MLLIMLSLSSHVLCRPPAVTYSFHGGAGLLISEGLLKAIPFEPMEACVQSQWMSGDLLLLPTSLPLACLTGRLRHKWSDRW